jgi:type IV pilus assembly protein PilV
MPLIHNEIQHSKERGATLIEVLVAMLLLAFGMLAIGSMMAFAVQGPKLSAYRSTAANLAASHTERMRANPEGFASNSYTSALHDSAWSFTAIDPTASDCVYPNCTETTLAAMDIQAARGAIRRELPAGDMEMWCSTPGATPPTAVACTKATQGNLWVIWQEPNTNMLLGASSDYCPPDLTSTYTGYTGSTGPQTPARCLYIQFKVE